MFPCFSVPTEFDVSRFCSEPSPAVRLESALSFGSSQACLKALEELDAPLDRRAARDCCYNALCRSPRVFAAVLNHCVPPRAVHTKKCKGRVAYPFAPSLILAAAGNGRIAHLKLLLERGCDPNVGGQTILECALNNRHWRCAEFLLDLPALEPRLTRELIRLWAQAGKGDKALDRCLRKLAAQLGLKSVPGNRFPIPPGLRLTHIAQQQNLSLALEYCRTRPLEPEECCRFLSGLVYDKTVMPEQLAQVLDAMFTACPTLLRRRWPRSALAACALAAPGGVPPILERWLDALPGKNIVLVPDPTLDWTSQHDPERFRGLMGDPRSPGLLARWEERLGGRFCPTLERRERIGHYLAATWDSDDDGDNPPESVIKATTELFTHCKSVGKAPKGNLSPLAEGALLFLPPKELVKQFSPDGALGAEDREEIIKCAMEEGCPREKRNLMLVYLRREAHYEL